MPMPQGQWVYSRSAPFGLHLTSEDLMPGLPLARPSHRMSESVESPRVLRQLEPLKVPEWCVEREVEGRFPLGHGLLALGWCGLNTASEVHVDAPRRGEVRQRPVSEAGDELDCLVPAVGSVSASVVERCIEMERRTSGLRRLLHHLCRCTSSQVCRQRVRGWKVQRLKMWD